MGTLPIFDLSLDVGNSMGTSRAGEETPILLEVAVNALLNSVFTEQEPSIGGTCAARGGEENESKAMDRTRGGLSY